MSEFNHPSGLPAAYDRDGNDPDRAGLIWPEGAFIQGADLNETQSHLRRRTRRVGNMIAKDGDRVDGAEIVIDRNAETASMTEGRIYISGTVLPVAARVIADFPLTGDVKVGVRLQTTLVTHEEDPTLLGLHPGTFAEGEPGAARENEALVWAVQGDAQSGDFFAVYLVRDGTVLDQLPPAALSGVLQIISLYDYDANGHYIVDGCEVSALGLLAGEQIFSIGAGTANIQGWKRVRETAMRRAETEAPDLESIAAEPQTYIDDDGSAVITVLRPPIAAVTQAVVVKQVEESVVRGTDPDGVDALANSAVTEVVSVVQGATTFAPTTDYVLSGNSISWAPDGEEPVGSSSYTVTYRYNAAVTPTAITPTTVTLADGVDGTTALISYTSKLPRIDLMCLDISGRSEYVKGVSARFGALSPQTPSQLLKLAEIRNDWLGVPVVLNNGTRNYTYDLQRRYFDRLITILDQFDRAEGERDILSRAPVAKAGIFTDTFVDDFFRDQGSEQSAAINQGVLQLAIDPIIVQRVGSTPVTMAFDEVVIVRQDLATSGMRINPYANLVRMPSALSLEPGVDFWNDRVTDWTSPTTQEFTSAPNRPPGSNSFNEVVSESRRVAQFLRQTEVDFLIEGFGVDEDLEALLFDDVDVTPVGLSGDADGDVAGSFTIPAGIPVGRRRVRAEGAAGSFAEAIFVGEGTIDVTTMRRVTLVTRAAPQPPPPPPPPPAVPPAVPPPPPVIIIQNNFIFNPWSGNGGLNDDNANGDGNGDADPLAQTFILPEGRHLAGVDFKFTEIGDPDKGVRVQLSSTVNGYPTSEVLAEAYIPMQGVEVGEWINARFPAPVFLPSNREFCFVILTDDPVHAVSISRLGDVDTATQEFVSVQPYVVGVLFSSANRRAWTPHQDADMTFRLVAAKFTETSKTVNLWTGDFVDISDVIVRGTVDIPTQAAAFRYELVRADGQVIQLSPGQTNEFPEFVNEEVTVRAVLTGTAKIAPLLFPGTQLIAGRIRASGTYITRVFPMGTAVEIVSLFAARVPSGAGATVDVDASDDSWTALTLGATGVLGGGWTEPRYAKASHTATNGRIRVTLTGTPAARPSIARLRAYSL
jgi:hypothetical protein